jgi:uncharacterized paraquat-inducible protein A
MDGVNMDFEQPTTCDVCGEVWDEASWVSCPRCQITNYSNIVRSLYVARDQLPAWARLRVEAMMVGISK